MAVKISPGHGTLIASKYTADSTCSGVSMEELSPLFAAKVVPN
jgi:hypothetical protein